MDGSGTGRKALKRQKAGEEAPVVAGPCDSCLRSDPVLLKYIDLPERPELRPSHLNRADRKLSRGKSIYLSRFPSALPSFQSLPACSADEGRRLILSAGLRVPALLTFHAGALLRTPAIPRLRSICLSAKTRAKASKWPGFLRGMEEEKPLSPFFGIFVLKRLSWVSKRPLPLSRDTLKAPRGTLVKHDFARYLAF
jgi:hypothetical protein